MPLENTMKVKALKSFGSTEYGHFPEGSVFDLPKGVDWLKAGLVEKVTKTTKKREAAALKDPEKR